jgi:predicted CXXCH cytochrome family protein
MMFKLRLPLFVLLTGLMATTLFAADADYRAPLGAGETIGWVHAPYEMGDCSLCHENSDAANPGALTMPVNDLCFMCHEQIAEMMNDMNTVHAAAEDNCTDCHNAHNATYPKLLMVEAMDLCVSCHEDVGETAHNSTVKHDPVVQGRACLNCHNPHASDVEMLLTQLPYDQCVDCHASDGMTDDQQKPMGNFATLITESHMRHGPVDAKDCSGCHVPHGSEAFRLLISDYPAKFYAGWDAETYGLCFTCHESDRFEQATTSTLTGFRDGDNNLHYVHVHKDKRGRTCRACHEVHASPQTHLIRDGVPYGSSGWELKINFTQEENGGTCAKTCHPALSYNRVAKVNK